MAPTRRARLKVAVLHNRDAGARADIADVENAARDVAVALRSRGHEVTPVALGSAQPVRALAETIERLVAARVELVFNLCEAVGGKSEHEPVVPHLLELAGLPYTGSGPLGLGLALRKDRARLLLASAGVPIPAGAALEAAPRRSLPLRYPLFVKLAGEDASVGIDRGSVVHDLRALQRRVDELLARYAGPVLVEEYVAGREIYVSLVGHPPVALPPHEIDFSAMPAEYPRIVTFTSKWEPGSVEDLGSRPARATKLGALRPLLAAITHRAFSALGLADYARVDFRVDPDGQPYVIDVNPNCDLSDGAGMSRAAGFAGWTHAELVDRICRSALARQAPARSVRRPARCLEEAR